MENKKIRLLFVEDNKIDRLMFKRFVKIERLPYDYVMSNSVSDAKSALKKETFNIVLTDYDLGDGTAFDLFEFIPKDTPVVIITGTGTEEIAVKAMKKGATDYLIKDPDGYYLKTLSITVEKALHFKAHEFALLEYKQHLKEMVQERTKELHLAIERLEREIEERKQVEDTLRKSEGKYSALVENSLDGIIIIQDGKLKFANQASLKLFCYTHEEMIGMDYLELIVPEDRKKSVLKYRKRKARTNMPAIVEMVLMRKDKTKVPVELNVTGDIDYQGRSMELMMIRDITGRIEAQQEKAKLEAQLMQAQKMETLGTLAGGIAHDFNNIIFSIMGYTEIVMAAISEDSKTLAHLNKILTASMRAKELVKQILVFSRQDVQELKPLKVQFIIEEGLNLIRASLPVTIEIRQNIDKNCSPVMADSTQIHQIIMNLCTNAFHAMEENGGILEVSLSEAELSPDDLTELDMTPRQYLCLKVGDAGHGMKQNVLKKVFEPYFTTKKQGKGTGLGLAVVHGIVKSIGGNIIVKSKPDKGTVFYVYLPMIKETFVPEKTKVSKILPTGNEHILLVDDEEMIVLMEKEILEKLGYNITARASSIDALEAFRAQPDKFDLVLTDMTMPNMTGDKLVTELMMIRPGIPVIICTGFSEQMSRERAEALGIKGFLMKPIVTKDMAWMIREVLNNESLSRRNSEAGTKMGIDR